MHNHQIWQRYSQKHHPHTDFINHQEIKAFDNPLLFLAESECSLPVSFMGLDAGKKRTERQLKKGMEGDAARIDCRNPGGCGDNHSLCRIASEVVQKGGFTGPGFPG